MHRPLRCGLSILADNGLYCLLTVWQSKTNCTIRKLFICRQCRPCSVTALLRYIGISAIGHSRLIVHLSYYLWTIWQRKKETFPHVENV